MCDHCFNASNYKLPSGVTVCAECFYESYCTCCWEHTNQVGATNDDSWCVTCVNNNLPQLRMHHHVINANEDNHDGPFSNQLFDEYIPQDEEDLMEDPTGALFAPPEGFDMNTASVVEHNPGYMNNLIHTQVEHEGIWYFTLDGQIYSVPYEIDIDDERSDIVDIWDGVHWEGTIFGNYVAWY